MAQRRMFSLKIIESAKFLKMPSSSRLLYYDLGMRADDDGIVEAFTTLRMTGATEDDLRVLVSKGYITILNEDLVSFIVDWQEHNKIRADRKVDSIYKNLLLQVNPDVELLESKERADRKKDVGTSQGQPKDGIGKDRLGKDSIGKDSIEKKKEKKKKTSSLDEIINNYTSNLELQETLQDFLKMRKAQKKPMTDRALKTLLKKLDTLATNDEEKIERLEESICNCWLTVYPKKDSSNKNYKQESLDTEANKNYENLKKIMKEQQEHYEENVAKYMADCEEVPF